MWLQGGLADEERPDRSGGVVDLESTGTGVRLGIREIRPGALETSPSLAAIAERHRNQMPVRVTDTGDVHDPDRPFRILLADEIEQRVAGDRIETYHRGLLRDVQRMPWLDRLGRRFSIWRRRRALARLSRSP